MLGRFRVLVIQVLLVGHESSSLMRSAGSKPALVPLYGGGKTAFKGTEQSAAHEMTSDRTFIYPYL